LESYLVMLPWRSSLVAEYKEANKSVDGLATVFHAERVLLLLLLS